MFRNKKLIWQLYASYLLIIFIALAASVLYVFFVLSNQPYLYQDVIEGSLIIAVLSAFVTYFVSKKITRPLEELKDLAQLITKGQFQNRLPMSESYEITALIQSINDMVNQLDERIKSVEKERNEKEAILSNMIEGVICVDLDERLSSVNKAATEFLGHDGSQKILGSTIQSVIRHTELQCFISKVLNCADCVKEGIVIQDRFGRYLHVHGTPLSNLRGHTTGALIVLHDVTQLKHLETIRKEFVANVSHELKTPVTLIQGFVETLLDGAAQNPIDRDRFLGIIKTHSDRLDAIIEDLLTLSRLEQYKDPSEIGFEKVCLNEVVLKVIDNCITKAAEKQITIKHPEVSTMYVIGNSHLLEQALLNLVENAIKYSLQNTEITLTLAQKDQHCMLIVTDQGLGIAEEHLSRIFERFYRVDKARSRKEGGTGLGLAIVKHIVQVQGGWVEVSSQVGHGSAFSMVLPIAS